jgi:hypothetical protein
MRAWLVVTTGAAATLTLLDALLLQRARGLFTGGFLAADYLDGTGAIAAFLLASFGIDVGVAGAAASIALYVLARTRLRQRAVIAGAAMFAVAPLLTANVVAYGLLRYVGGAFDLGLMFDLTGRSVSEMFAVASSHLIGPAVSLIAVCAAALATLWAINRAPGVRFGPTTARVLAAGGATAVLGAVILTIAVSTSDALANGLLRKPAGGALRFTVSQLTDIDRDGFGLVGRFPDPEPFDSRVFPYAVDVPGNGIDENGVGGDLPRSTTLYVEPPQVVARWQHQPDVVLFALESFRADLVGASLQGRPITPVMNALGARGLSAPRAFSHNGYTIQSRFHLLAGSLIARVNARTLIDDFKSNGYVVGWFSGQDESFGPVEYQTGFDRADIAYDARADIDRRYSTFATPGSLAVPLSVVRQRVTSFLEHIAADSRPLFLYVNFEDTHFPYWHSGIEPLISTAQIARRDIAQSRRELLWATYANTAANVDRAIGEVLATMQRVRGREPGIVITADHGESLYDSGFLGHGYHLDDVQTRVPLIVVNLPMRVPDPFGHSDLRAAINQALAATVMEPPHLQPTGRPVLQYLGDLASPRQIAFFRDGTRLIYDFRTRRVQHRGGAWRAVSTLEPSEHAAWVELVRQWEAIKIKRESQSR